MGRGSGPTDGAMYFPTGYCFGTSWTGPGGSAPRRTRARRGAGFMKPGSIAVHARPGQRSRVAVLSAALVGVPVVRPALPVPADPDLAALPSPPSAGHPDVARRGGEPPTRMPATRCRARADP